MTQISRRSVLLNGASAAAIGLAGPLAVLPSTALAQLRDKGYYSYKIGPDIEVVSIYDGIWEAQLAEGFVQGATLEEVRKALKDGGYTGNFMPIEFAFTVVKTRGRTILVDAGTGAQLGPTAGNGSVGMQNAGITVADIDTVIISHMHPDHIWGLLEKDTNAQVMPHAEIMIGEREFRFWTDETNNASLPDSRRGHAARIQATFPEFKNVTLFGENTKDIAPGISAVAAPGHTLGHNAFHISSGDDQLMVLGDLVLTPSVFVKHPDWQVAVDMDKDAAKTTRFGMMERAVAENMTVAGYHFGFPNSGKIQRDGAGFAFVPTSA